MDDTPHREDYDEVHYEESLIGSGEAMLQDYRIAERELAFLRDLRRRNLAYPARSPEAEAELQEIEAEISQWSRLVEV